MPYVRRLAPGSSLEPTEDGVGLLVGVGQIEGSLSINSMRERSNLAQIRGAHSFSRLQMLPALVASKLTKVVNLQRLGMGFSWNMPETLESEGSLSDAIQRGFALTKVRRRAV